MSDPWDRPSLPTRGDDNQNDTYAAVGRVLSLWEQVESELGHLFALFIGKYGKDEAYDQYYEKGKTTQGRLNSLQREAKRYFTRSPSQEIEGHFCSLMKFAIGFADRRHEVAHGVVRPIEWYGSLLPELARPLSQGGFKFCLVPPHYQRNWITNGIPEYIYTSAELGEIEKQLFLFAQQITRFKWDYLMPSPWSFGPAHITREV